MKTIDIIRKSVPEKLGYNDSVAIIENGNELWSGPGASYPNPYKPIDKTPWFNCYALIKEGEYNSECVINPRFFKCLRIENGGLIPTLNPNTNHKNLYVANGVFVHRGESELWRGSSGCITIAPSLWESFISKMYLDEKIKIIIREVK